MGREDRPGAHGLEGLVDRQALVDDEAADALEAEEAGVALVGVEHLRGLADGVEGPDAPDAQEDLLAQPVLGVASVEPVGHRPAGGVVAVDVGVEQVEVHPSDVGAPDPGDDRSVGEVDLDDGALDQPHRHGVGIEGRVPLLLPAVVAQVLTKVPVPVQQTDPHEGDAEVARRLEVVTSQHTQPARVLGEGLGDAELRREVGHRPQGVRSLSLEPQGRFEVAVQIGVHLPQEAGEGGVGGQGLEPLRIGGVQDPQRVMPGELPAVGIDPPEQIPGPLVPRPPQVCRQLVERRQRLGQPDADREAAKRPHSPGG